MNYYWSCWFTKEELKSMGAIGAVPARFNHVELIPNHNGSSIVEITNHWAFQAEESFPLFLKLKSDKTVAEISRRRYLALQRGKWVKVGSESKVGFALTRCYLDF